jgi:sugar lactone lactonase YvrE
MTPGTMSSFQAPRCGSPQVLWSAGAQLGEGLCWSPREQAIYWVDILGQLLMRLTTATGERTEWRFDQTISAIAEREAGPGLVVALRHGVAFFDPGDGTLRLLHEPEAGRPGNRFNDGKCDPQGRFWVGSMDFACREPTGSLYCLSAEGASTVMHCAWKDNFPVNNGPAWSPDGRTMWLNDTARNVVHRGAFDPASGTLSDMAPWLRFERGDGYPDGMTTDRDGRLWIAHWAGACVTCHAPDDGRELARIALPTSNVTNVAFGGPQRRTLFITSASVELAAPEPLAGALFAVETDSLGLEPHRFAG